MFDSFAAVVVWMNAWRGERLSSYRNREMVGRSRGKAFRSSSLLRPATQHACCCGNNMIRTTETDQKLRSEVETTRFLPGVALHAGSSQPSSSSESSPTLPKDAPMWLDCRCTKVWR